MSTVSNLLKDRFAGLFVSLVLLVFVFPFLNSTETGELIFGLLLSAIPLSGIYALSIAPRHKRTAWTLAIPFLIVNILNCFTTSAVVFYLDNVLAVTFYIYTIAITLHRILSAQRVTRHILLGAVSVYLLLGIAWAALYSTIETIRPLSFENTVHRDHLLEIVGRIDWSDFIYFSFTTLSTVGYGDIVPRGQCARSFAVLESLTGLFYMALLISRLVSIHTASSLQKGVDSNETGRES